MRDVEEQNLTPSRSSDETAASPSASETPTPMEQRPTGEVPTSFAAPEAFETPSDVPVASGEPASSPAFVAQVEPATTAASATATTTTTATATAATTEPDEDDLGGRFEESLKKWVLDTAKGIVTSTATVLFVLVLAQLGLASEGQSLSFDLFSPYEFWKSFTGLVVTWSQWNESLLLVLAIGATAVTVGLFLWWRRHEARVGKLGAPTQPPTVGGRKSKRRSVIFRAQSALRSMKGVSALGMIAALLFGAYFYQQYLWNVELPVPSGQIGIAFTRQVGNSIARDTLAESLRLRQMGYGDQIVLRDLPVTFDPKDIAQAQQFARRINAHAVVIYNEVKLASGGADIALRVPGLASPSQQQDDSRSFVAYLVFADPSLGIEIPVTQESGEGQADTVASRTKEGLEVPRIEGSDTTRLMEAAAGILMYDRDRYPAAVTHLQNAVQNGGLGNSSDALAYLYIGNSYYLLNKNGEAAGAFDSAIRAGEATGQPGVQERLVLAQAYINRAKLYYNTSEYEQSEALLKKALDVKEMLDQNETALASPVVFRQLREMAGNAYLRLLDLAIANKDEDARKLWNQRAGDEARALAARTDDARAMSASIRLLYSSGSCDQAYSIAYDLLEKDPNSPSIRRNLAGLATFRDQNVLSLEAMQQRKELLRINPNSLPDLHFMLTNYSLRAMSSELGYLNKAREITDRILEIDPTNVEAIEQYLKTVDTAGTLDQLLLYVDPASMEAVARLASYVDDAGSLNALIDPMYAYSPIGDGRTLRKVLTRQLQDPETIKKLVAFKEEARPYIVRWSQEADTESADPIAFGARYSRDIYDFVSLYQSLNGVVDQELINRIEQRAFDEANRVLALEGEGRRPTPRQLAEAHSSISKILRSRYLQKFLEQDKEAAGKALLAALEHSRIAADLVEKNPPFSPSELNLERSIYNDYYVASFFATFYFEWIGDTVRQEEYTELSTRLKERATELQDQVLTPLDPGDQYLRSFSCPGTGLLKSGNEAMLAGDYGAAIDNLTQYNAIYQYDPVGAWSLAWAQYRNGDLDEALTTLDRAGEATPGVVTLWAKKAVVLVAEGDIEGARQALSDFFSKLESEPFEPRVRALLSVGYDLQDLAANNTAARDGVKKALAELAKYVGQMSGEDRLNDAAQVILALNELGTASIWSGDYEQARNFLQGAIALNEEYVPARANMALALFASGDAKGATAEYNATVKAAATYAKRSDGTTLEGASLNEAFDDARAELEAAAADLEKLMTERPERDEAGGQIVEMLRQAASTYER